MPISSNCLSAPKIITLLLGSFVSKLNVKGIAATMPALKDRRQLLNDP